VRQLQVCVLTSINLRFIPTKAANDPLVQDAFAATAGAVAGVSPGSVLLADTTTKELCGIDISRGVRRQLEEEEEEGDLADADADADANSTAGSGGKRDLLSELVAEISDDQAPRADESGPGGALLRLDRIGGDDVARLWRQARGLPEPDSGSNSDPAAVLADAVAAAAAAAAAAERHQRGCS